MVLLALLGCASIVQAQPRYASLPGIPDIPFAIIAQKPSDKTAYTQGLQLVDDKLYLGTGLYGQSHIQVIDWATGDVILRRALPDTFFGEGVAVSNGHVYQLTWKVGLLYVYHQRDLSLANIHTYQGEGWGLAHDGSHFIMSDGTATLTFRDSDTFAVERTVDVTSNGQPVGHLNELEWVNGWLLANRWGASDILVVDPLSAQVMGQLRFGSIVEEMRQRLPTAGVLNGIAYDSAESKLLVTGKNWDRIYVIEADLRNLKQ